jgi:hypothetical protein
MLQCRLFRHVVLDILHGLTYEILGIRPLLIDKLSSILIPKTGSYCPVRTQLTSYSSSVLQRGSTITAFARALARALEMFLATIPSAYTTATPYSRGITESVIFLPKAAPTQIWSPDLFYRGGPTSSCSASTTCITDSGFRQGECALAYFAGRADPIRFERGVVQQRGARANQAAENSGTA